MAGSVEGRAPRLLPLLAMLVLAAVVEAGDGDLEQRLGQLEQENRELRDRVARLERGEDDVTLAEEVDAYVEEGLGLDMRVKRGDVQATFQIFGDTGARYDNPAVAGRSNGFLSSGGVDFFFTARAGDHFHLLSETVFLPGLGEPKDSGDFDQERLWGAWDFSDAIRVKFGLEHGPISRWNNLFHHGKWLEITIRRPLLARFESDNGVLPMHNIGFEVGGSRVTSLGKVGYILIVSNGRGRVPTDTHEFSDRNDSKAFDFGLSLRPEALPELWIGAFFRVDDMPPNPTDPARQRSIRQLIGSFQVDYRGELLEVLFELAWVGDRDRQSGSDFDHLLAYVQVAYHLDDRWTPYARFDIREMDLGDPYYAPFGRDLDVWELLFGIRHELTSNVSLKFEFGFGDAETRNAAGVVRTRSYLRLAFQLAWVF